MRDEIRFILGSEEVRLAGLDPTGTLLDWLRGERGLTGTKEGCAEGDCGACTVAVGRPEGDAVRYEAINSCIRFLPTLHGCHVLTVEHLAEGGVPHPVQRAVADGHGSQCGFCTPGFVMSLFCLLGEGGGVPTRARVVDAVAGNLCRCTGYRPIVDAALAAAAQPAPPARPDGMAARLRALDGGGNVRTGAGGRRFVSPASEGELRALLREHPDAVLVAGATDVGLWVTKEMRVLDPVVFLGRIAALREIEDRGDALTIGAAVTHARARPVLGALHPQIDELLRRFGGEQVRNAGTVGGNVANGSPIGDLPPLFLALGASVELDGPDGARALPIERFFLGYKRQDRRPGEYVRAVTVPKPDPDDRLHVSKVTKRFDEDISAVCGAFRLRLGADGRVAAARLAFGGMAAIPKRAERAEAALLGRVFDEDAAADAAAALAADFTPLDDLRASARYRLLVAGNLLRRFALDASGEPTRVAGPLAGRAA